MATFLFVGLSNKEPIKIEASQSSYQIVTDITASPTYNLILNAGYYIFVNDGTSFKTSMVLGDAKAFADYDTIKFTPTYYCDKMSVEEEYKSKITEMLTEFDTYFKITSSGSNWITNLLFIKVNSYAVLDTNTTDNIYHLNGFYVETKPVVTDLDISGSKTHLINIDSPLSLEKIKSRYTATDAVDGDITDKIQFVSDYSLLDLSPRNYYIYKMGFATRNI